MPAVSGTVKDANGNFARRLVRVHRRDTGALVGETLSNPSTGAWSVTTADRSKHCAVVHDSDAWITYLPMNGDNGSTSFPEWGGKTVTAYGNAQISTAQSKFGGASAYFDGAGDYLSMAASAGFAFGASDFTVEMWGYLPEARSNCMFDSRVSPADTGGFYLGTETTGKLAVWFNQNAWTPSVVVPTNEWCHIAFVRTGDVHKAYINGSLVNSATLTGKNWTSNNFRCGMSASNAESMLGYIDDLRISKGVARYIANFTPPTAPHGDALALMGNAMVFDFLTPV